MRRLSLEAIVLLCSGSAAAAAQSLGDRINAQSQPRVQFNYAARAEVCGNGRSFIRVGGNQWYGSWNGVEDREPCVSGPVRVILDRAGRDVISINTLVGPARDTLAGVVDMGRVSVRDAADYLMRLAESAEGRVSRDAILPAMLADSVDLTARLLAVAKNQNIGRETRRTAIGWLARPLDTSERMVRDVASTLVGLARDEDDNQNVRQAALRGLARLEHGAGTEALMQLAREADRNWMAREALSALTSSGDPRARQYLRDVVRKSEINDDILASAVRGIGGEFATAEDARLLRDVYTKLPGERSRDAALSALSQIGGAENVRWLMTLARNPDLTNSIRRRALQYAYRAGASVGDIIKVYDETTDVQIKESALAVLIESGDRRATDKLMQIARSDESPTMRRRAVGVLSRSSDERVKKFLSDLATSGT